MKKKLLVLGLLAVFALGACKDADQIQGPVGPQGEAGAPGEAGPVGPQGPKGEDGQSAYSLYKELNPSYTGSEEQWIKDLCNGKLAQKDSDNPEELVEVDCLDPEVAEEYEDRAALKVASFSGLEEIGSYYYESYDENFHVDYHRAAACYRDDVIAEETHQYPSEIQMGYLVSYPEETDQMVCFPTTNGKQVAFYADYYYESHETLNFFDLEEGQTAREYYFAYTTADLLADYMLVKDANNHLYGISYQTTYSGATFTQGVYSYKFMSSNIYFTIADFNTVSDPYLVRVACIDLETRSHSYTGYLLEEPMIVAQSESVITFNYGGATLQQDAGVALFNAMIDGYFYINSLTLRGNYAKFDFVDPAAETLEVSTVTIPSSTTYVTMMQSGDGIGTILRSGVSRAEICNSAIDNIFYKNGDNYYANILNQVEVKGIHFVKDLEGYYEETDFDYTIDADKSTINYNDERIKTQTVETSQYRYIEGFVGVLAEVSLVASITIENNEPVARAVVDVSNVRDLM